MHYGPVRYDEFDVCFDWVKKNGLPSESACPYLSKRCRSDDDHNDGCHSCPAYRGGLWYFSAVDVGDSVRRHIPGQNVLMVMEAIQMYGSVLSSFNVFDNFMSYTGGIYASTEMTPTVGRHAIRLIGWGKSDDGREYWIVANSWGRRWGEAGYFRFLKGDDLCGIESADHFSAKLEPGPLVESDSAEVVEDLQVVPGLERTTKSGSIWVAQDVNHRHWSGRMRIPELQQNETWKVVGMRTSVAAGLHLEFTMQDASGAVKTVPVFEPVPVIDNDVAVGGESNAGEKGGVGRPRNSAYTGFGKPIDILTV